MHIFHQGRLSSIKQKVESTIITSSDQNLVGLNAYTADDDQLAREVREVNPVKNGLEHDRCRSWSKLRLSGRNDWSYLKEIWQGCHDPSLRLHSTSIELIYLDSKSGSSNGTEERGFYLYPMCPFSLSTMESPQWERERRLCMYTVVDLSLSSRIHLLLLCDPADREV